jgi:hypothetical protein
LHAWLVVNLPNAGDTFGEIPGPPLGLAAVHRPLQGDLTRLHRHLDLAGVDPGI